MLAGLTGTLETAESTLLLPVLCLQSQNVCRVDNLCKNSLQYAVDCGNSSSHWWLLDKCICSPNSTWTVQWFDEPYQGYSLAITVGNILWTKTSACCLYLPLPFSPNARADGTVIFRFSPGHIPIIPMSRPLMTCPTPSTNHWGCPSLSDRLRQKQ